MQTSVNKIGGESMSQPGKVAHAVEVFRCQQEEVTLVVSAFQKVTNALIKAMDGLNETDYTENNIDQAFEPVQELHQAVIDTNFEGDFKERAEQVYRQKYEALREALMRHKQISKILSPVPGSFEIRDQVIGFGEKMGGLLIQIFLEQKGYETHLFEQVICKKDGLGGEEAISRQRLHEAIRAGMNEAMETVGQVRAGVIQIFTGHVAGTPRGITVDVGRSYSDTTAVDVGLTLMARGESIAPPRVLKAVRGVMTADHKYLDLKKNKPQVHTDVSMNEALEMASAGSNLIQIDALDLAQEHRLDLELRNIDTPEKPGTNFTGTEITTPHVFKSIVPNPEIDTITVKLPSMANRPGFIQAISTIFGNNDINLDGVYTEGTSLTFSIPLPPDPAEREAYRVKIRQVEHALQTITVKGEVYEAQIEWRQETLGCISVVGNELADKPGILSVITGVFGAFGINIYSPAHATAQRRVSFLVNRTQLKRAVQLLHSIFVDGDPEVIAAYKTQHAAQVDEYTATYQKPS